MQAGCRQRESLSQELRSSGTLPAPLAVGWLLVEEMPAPRPVVKAPTQPVGMVKSLSWRSKREERESVPGCGRNSSLAMHLLGYSGTPSCSSRADRAEDTYLLLGYTKQRKLPVCRDSRVECSTVCTTWVEPVSVNSLVYSVATPSVQKLEPHECSVVTNCSTREQKVVW